MKIFILALLFLFSCSEARLKPQSAFNYSKNKKATLEILSSKGEKGNFNDAVLKAKITNLAEKDLTLDLKKSYNWSAWYRWQRRPKKVSESPIVLKPHESTEVSWTFMRREYGVMLIPFVVGDEEDEIQVKFEYCSPWDKVCKNNGP
jgi:hypothetical protein